MLSSPVRATDGRWTALVHVHAQLAALGALIGRGHLVARYREYTYLLNDQVDSGALSSGPPRTVW